MKSALVRSCAAVSLLVAVGCGGTSDPEPIPTPAALAASNVRIDDITNAQDGTDIEVTFDAALDETGITEYRILVRKAATAGAFTAADAAQVAAGNYTAIAPSGQAVRTTLAADARDTDGDVIGPDVSYAVYVLSVADGTDAVGDAISGRSNEISLAVTTVKITYLGNDGVSITDGTNTVVIDALHRTETGWIVFPVAERTKLERGEAPYDGIDVAMATHNHGDHVNPSSVNTFLGANPGARYIAPPPARGGVTATSQIVPVDLVLHARHDTVINGVPISVFHLNHFDQFGNNFSSVQNYGYLVELGGLKLLHLGDVRYSTANLGGFGLDTEGVDVVFLPTFNTLLSEANRDVIEQTIAPAWVVALHFQGSQVATESASAESLYDPVTAFTEPLQFLRR